MAMPALAAARAQGPVLGVGEPSVLELLQDGGALDEGLSYRRHGDDRGWRGGLRTAARARAWKPERVIVFPPSLRAALLARGIGTDRRVGQTGLWRRFLLSDRQRGARPSRTRHLADEWLSLASEAPDTIRNGMAQTRFIPGPRGRDGLLRLRRELPQLPPPGGYVVVAAGATYGSTKRWPSEAFGELVQRLRRRTSFGVVLVGSDQERHSLQELAESSGGLCIAGLTDLPTLAAMLSESVGFVGNDSGPMHLAAAVGVPTLGIFGSTSPAWTGPRGLRARVVGPAPVHCSPCFRRRCPFELQCLRELRVDEVWTVFEELTSNLEAQEGSRE